MAGEQNQKPAGDVPLDMEALRKELEFDPFEQGANFGSGSGGGQSDDDDDNTQGDDGAAADESDQGGDGADDQAGSGGEDAGRTGKQPAAKTPAQGSGDGRSPEAASDDQKRAMETLQGMVQALLKAPQAGQEQQQGAQSPQGAQGQQGQGEQPKDPKAEAPKYQFSIPPQVAEAVASDDPAVRQTALSAVVNSVMNTLAKDFKEALDTTRQDLVQTVMAQIPQVIERREATKRVEEDFYSAFPVLGQMARANPAFHQAIWSVVTSTAQAEKLQNWNPEFRDRVGNYLHVSLGVPARAVVQQGQGQGGKPAGQGQGNGRTPRKPSFNAGSGNAGGAGNRNGPTPGQEFLDVLFAGQS